MNLIVPKSSSTQKMLNEFLFLTPPKVRKKLFLWQHIYRENYTWISNHMDHQPLADVSSIRAQNDELDY